MKVINTVAGVSLLWGALVGVALPGINCGSRESGFIVKDNATLDLSGLTLNDMYLRSLGGDIISLGANRCNNVTIENATPIQNSSYIVDGLMQLGGALALGDGDRLLLKGGVVMPLTVNNSSYSVIQGYGQFSEAISVQAGQLKLGLESPLNVSLNAAADGVTFVFESDLSFAPGVSFTGSPSMVGFMGYRLMLGGRDTTLAVDQAWIDAVVELNGAVALATNKSIMFGSLLPESLIGGLVNGNGNALTFGEGSLLNNNGLITTITDAVLKNAIAGCLSGTAAWNVNNVTFEHGDNSVTVTGAISSGAEGGAIDMFGTSVGVVNFGSNAIVHFNKNTVLEGTWVLNGGCLVNGNGYTADLSSGTLQLEGSASCNDVNFINMSSAVISNATGEDGYPLYLSNVEWSVAAGDKIRINPLVNSSSGAACYVYGGDIFTSSNSCWSGALIELLTNVTLNNTGWFSYGEGLIIEGQGNSLDLAAGVLAVNGADITLRNVVLTNFGQNSFANYGTYRLSNVVIKLAGNVDWREFDISVVIDGPVTIITGDYTFKVGSLSVIDGVTVYYDTLNRINSNNVTGFTLQNNGRLLFVDSVEPENLNIIATSNGTVYLNTNEYLVAESASIASNVASFSGAYTTVLDGLGRSLVFPTTSDPVFSVATASTVITQNIVFDGLTPQQLDGEGKLYFGNNTTIRLTHDWVLDRTLIFGSSTGATNQVMTLDLCGFTIDMADAAAALELQGVSGQTLHINNGRLINLSSAKLTNIDNASTNKFVFENVEFVLSDDFYLMYNLVTEIHGHCIISGVADKCFFNLSDCTFAITTGSTLTVMNGLVFQHLSLGNMFSMTDSSTLELIGSKFQWNPSSDSVGLELSTGRLIIDHQSTFDTGYSGCSIIFDESLDVEIRPGALLEVAGDGVLVCQNLV